MTPEDWKLAATVVLSTIPSAITTGTLWKFRQEIQKFVEGIDTANRVGPLVEGNTKEHKDEQVRKGLIGRVKDLEAELARRLALIDALNTVIEGLSGKLRAVLRGLGLPSDISDNGDLEKAIKAKAKEARYPIDRLAAQLEMSGDRGDRPSDHERTGPHQSIERVPRPDPHPQPRRPALQGRRPGSGPLRDPRIRERRDDVFDERRDPTYPPPDSDDEDGS